MAYDIEKFTNESSIESSFFRGWLNRLIDLWRLGRTPIGAIIDFGGATSPRGYLLCDGSAISRTTYAELFAVIGTTWGVGDGTTTFNIPSLARRVTIGSGGAGTATISNTLASVGGEESHALITAELAAHTHVNTLTDPGHIHGNTDPGHIHGVTDPGHTHVQINGGAYNGGVGHTSNGYVDESDGSNTTNLLSNSRTTGLTVNNNTSNITINSNTSNITINNISAGSGTAHNTIQPSAVVNKLIFAGK
jgi:microcystin-dependent protein